MLLIGTFFYAHFFVCVIKKLLFEHNSSYKVIWGKLKMKIKKRIYIILAICLIISAVGADAAKSTQIVDDSVLRLHVIANSDSTEDQQIKLTVRDKVIEELSKKLKDAKDQNDAKNIIIENLDMIDNIANEILVENGFNYNATTEVGVFAFPKRQYGNIVYEAGNYEAVEIKLGRAAGKNWWCVVFPPLCFVDIENSVAETTEEQNVYNNETNANNNYVISEEQDTVVQFKSKIAEFFGY